MKITSKKKNISNNKKFSHKFSWANKWKIFINIHSIFVDLLTVNLFEMLFAKLLVEYCKILLIIIIPGRIA